MTIHNLMNAANVIPEVHIDVFDLFHNNLIYSGRYEESPVGAHLIEVYEFEVKSMIDHHNGLKIDRMTITADHTW